jgi:hypothetical protein
MKYFMLHHPLAGADLGFDFCNYRAINSKIYYLT